MTISATITAIKTALKTDLPALLATAGLTDFQDYYDYYLENPDKKIVSVYPAEAKDIETQDGLTVLVQVNLPKIINPATYVDVIWEYIKSIKAYTFNYTTLDRTQAIMYPGDWGGGGGGCYILYELDFNKDKDSCD